MFRPSRWIVPVLVLAGSLYASVSHFWSGSATPTPVSAAPLGTVPTTLRPTSTTTVPLVQNMTKPPLHDPALDARMADFFYGLRDYNNARADKAFLPMRYYVVLKAGGGNEADWNNRLITHYHQQLAELRARFRTVLPGATYRGYAIKSATAHTVPVGAEMNKAPYWQVYQTTMAFRDKNNQPHNFIINTMISFRGAWWIVHVIGYG